MRAAAILASCAANSLHLWRRTVVRPPRYTLNARTFIATTQLWKIRNDSKKTTKAKASGAVLEPPRKYGPGRPKKGELRIPVKRPVGRPKKIKRGRKAMVIVRKVGRPRKKLPPGRPWLKKPSLGRPRKDPAAVVTKKHTKETEGEVSGKRKRGSGEEEVVEKRKTRRLRKEKIEAEAEVEVKDPIIYPPGVRGPGRPKGSKNLLPGEIRKPVKRILPDRKPLRRGRPPRHGPELPTDPKIRKAMFKTFRYDVRSANLAKKKAENPIKKRGRPLAPPGLLTQLARAALEKEGRLHDSIQKDVDNEENKEQEVELRGEDDSKSLDDKVDGRLKTTEDRAKKWTGRGQKGTKSGSWAVMSSKAAKDQSPILYKLLESGVSSPNTSGKPTIISEAQCTEIFERFPLDDYRGCHIIDFNPSFGVYSRALNAAVRPSKHFLLEPEEQFHPFLEITCKDKSFELRGDDFYNWQTFDHLLENGLSVDNVPLEQGVNKSLIVTGMLQKGMKGDRFMAQILDSIGKRDWVFKYGRIKVLAWLDDEMVGRYLPRSFGRRNRAAVLIEAFTNARELAHPVQTYSIKDVAFFHRIDRYRATGKVDFQQDVIHGVEHADLLTFVTMPRDPPAIVFQPKSYWPRSRWASTTLFDITPKIPNTYLAGKEEGTDPWMFFNIMLSSMFMSRNSTVEDALRRIGSGVEMLMQTDDDLKTTPELGQKKTMFLSVEDLVRLARAYEFWPWRVDDPFLGAEMRLRRTGMVEDDETRRR